MNEQEEVDFFLPDGILDEEEQEEEPGTTNANPWVAPPENPWANDSRPQHAWNNDAQQQQQRYPAAATSLESNQLSHAADATYGTVGVIGSPSFDSDIPINGPLHQNGNIALMPEGFANGHQQQVPFQSPSMHAHQTSTIQPPPSHFPNNNESPTLPFRPPPGFSHLSYQQQQQQHPIRSRIIQDHDAPLLQPILNHPDDDDNDDDNDDDDESIRSVPHELYDRESMSAASSLSGSSSVDESSMTPTPNTSSILDDTPNTSALNLLDSMEQVAESRDELVAEKQNGTARRNDRDDVVEKSSSRLSEAPSKEEEVLRPNTRESKASRTPSSPVNKSRNRRGNKAKRNKSNNTATTSSKPKAATTKTTTTTTTTTTASVCVENGSKQTTPYLEYVRASVDWTSGLIQHFLSVLHDGIQTFLLFFKSTASFWSLLLRLAQKVLFTTIRGVAIFISFSLLVAQHAILEAIYEWRVLSYYLIMYFFPHVMSVLMKRTILPHWTPHLLSCVVLYYLCRQPKRLRLYAYTVTLNNDNASPNNGNTARTISRVILRQVRFNLPMTFLLDGFSHELGATFSLSGSGRIVCAYFMLMTRFGLLFSPMAWLCGAIQVLLAHYLHWACPVIDVCVAMTSLTSIRYCKFLEECNQAAKEIREKEAKEK